MYRRGRHILHIREIRLASALLRSVIHETACWAYLTVDVVEGEAGEARETASRIASRAITVAYSPFVGYRTGIEPIRPSRLTPVKV